MRAFIPLERFMGSTMENLMPRFGIVWILVVWAGITAADKFEVNLYKHLMNPDRYEAAIRPTPDHRLSTNVTFGFLLHQVINVDEKNQQLTTSSWMNVNWMDQRLNWNHTEWGGLKLLHIPHHKVWKPDIILTNNADPEYKEAAVSTDVFVTPDGNVTWLYFAIYQSSCQIRVRFYPFDDQECSMTFASWSHDGTDVNLLLLTEEGDLSNYVNSSEWQMLSMTAHRRVLNFSVGDGPWPVITITIRLGRRPLFYVFNHILPCVLISIMSMLGFYIPAETGEKVTMCITTMLSMGVFLKTITESMPPTSEAVPLIGMYYGVSLFIVCAATVVNVVTLNVHNRGYKNTPDPVPGWAQKYILGYMANMLCITVHPADSQMVHLAEKRRQMANDDDLLNELAKSRNYAEAFGTPVVLRTEFDEIPDANSHELLAEAGCTEAQVCYGRDRCATYHVSSCNNTTVTSDGRSRVKCNLYDKNLNRYKPTRATVASGAVGRMRATGPKIQHQPVTGVSSIAAGPMTSRKSSARSPSIYDYDYELEALRRLNSQASLLSGALSLIHAPLRSTRSSGAAIQNQRPPNYNGMSNTAKTTAETSRSNPLVTKLDSTSIPIQRARPDANHRFGHDNTAKSRISHAETHGSTYLHPHQSQSQPGPTTAPTANGPTAGVRLAKILKDEFEDKFQSVLKKVYQTLEQNELRMALQEERSRIMWEWKQLAIIVDRLLLLLFVLATGLTTFLILFEPIIFEDKLPGDDDIPPVI